MDQVVEAIENGRCALAVSGSLLRDPEVMLALTRRGALNPMALSGPAVSPVVPVGEAGAARALGVEGGVLVLVEPERQDVQGLQALGKLIARGPHKPTVVVVSRNFNPFALGSALQGVKIEHAKGRGKAFLSKLPTPPADAPVPSLPSSAPAKKKADAVRFVFAGRDEEVEALAAILGEGGPVVVSGPSGVGRSQLVAHAAARAGLDRLPDLALGWDSGFDTLLGRLAVACDHAGQGGLLAALRDSARTPRKLVDAAVEALSAADGLAGKVMVVHRLEFALGPEADFFRRSRLELLVEALLTHPFPLRLVFVSTRQPTFHREGQGAPLRRVEVGGIKGRFLHEIFEAYKAPEFPREKFGPISERIHGHPFAAILFAATLRGAPDPDKLVDDDKFFKLKGLGDERGIARRIDKLLARLDKPQRATLALLAHARLPLDGSALADLTVSRKERLALLASGLLSFTGTAEDKQYRVHPLVAGAMSWREVHDFKAAEELAATFRELAGKASDPVWALAYRQEANRLLVGARRGRSRERLPVPDHDAVLDSVMGLMRSKNPRLDMARQRIEEVLGADPANADAWLLRAELERRAESKGEEILGALEQAADKAPVPEVFHRIAGYWLGRRKRVKAIEALQKAVEALPDEPRLHTRLASLLLQQGRRPEGLEHLQRAMELAPMLPDAYGLLGQARRAEGRIDEAEELLREAARLGADDPVQIARLVDLLLARARVDLERQDALREEARELLDRILAGDRPAPDALLLKATLVRETTGDLEQAGWLLGKARKASDRGTDRHRRVQIEAALQAMAAGRLDEAENALRDRCARDPSDHRAFAALAHVLEAREMYVPAHAEYLRARDRAPKGSVEAEEYALHLARMQAVIEAQAAGLTQPVAASPEPAPTAPVQGPQGHQRVIRRRKRGEDQPEDGSQSGASEAAEASGAPEADASDGAEA